MKRAKIFAFCLLIILVLSGCDATKITYPCFQYLHSSYTFDVGNKTICLEEGYVLDDGHSYDIVETDEGYDIVFHMIKEN